MDPAIKPKDGGGASSSLVLFVINSIVLAYSCMKAYTIRTIAIKEFGRIIHEFDPWFNYRAAEYLHAHGRGGLKQFESPAAFLGLGIQFTAVGIFHALNYLGMPMSLNDVCCFMPAWFGVSASLFTGLIALECSGSPTAAAFTTMIMAIIPAHAMRSIAQHGRTPRPTLSESSSAWSHSTQLSCLLSGSLHHQLQLQPAKL
eukprot:gene23000-30191_t